MTESKPNKKKRRSKEELEYFKNLILDKRRETIKAVKRLEEATRRDNSTGGSDSTYAYHMADVGTDAQEREKDYLWLSREKKFLGHLNSALDRIDSGEYGVCIECGEFIPKERLEEVPHTQHCAQCKNKPH